MTLFPWRKNAGLTVPLGDFVLREACARMKQWHATYPAGTHPRNERLDMSVNLSPGQLRDLHFVARICAALNETGLDPRQLKLEITEAVLIDDFPSVRASVNALKDNGHRISDRRLRDRILMPELVARFAVRVAEDRSFLRQGDDERRPLA